MSAYIDKISGGNDLPPIELLPQRKLSFGARLVEIIKSPFYALFGVKSSEDIAITVLRSQFSKEMGDLERLTKAINLSFSKTLRDKARAELMKIDPRSYDGLPLRPSEREMLQDTLQTLQERHKSEVADENMERHIVALSLDHLQGISREIYTAAHVEDGVRARAALFGLKANDYENENLSRGAQAKLRETLIYLQELHKTPEHITRLTQRHVNEELILVAHPFGGPIVPQNPFDLVDRIQAAGATAQAVELIEKHRDYITQGGAGIELRKVIVALEEKLKRQILGRKGRIAASRQETQHEGVRLSVRHTLDSMQKQISLAKIIREKEAESELIQARIQVLMHSDVLDEQGMSVVPLTKEYCEMRERISDPSIIRAVESATVDELTAKLAQTREQMQKLDRRRSSAAEILSQTATPVSGIAAQPKSFIRHKKTVTHIKNIYESDPQVLQIFNAMKIRLRILEAEQALQATGGIFTDISQGALADYEGKILTIRAEAALEEVDIDIDSYLEQAEKSHFLERDIEEAREKMLHMSEALHNSATVKTQRVKKKVRIAHIEDAPPVALAPQVSGLYNRVQAALNELATIDAPLSDRLRALPLKEVTSDKVEGGAPAAAFILLQELKRAQRADKFLLEQLQKVSIEG